MFALRELGVEVSKVEEFKGMYFFFWCIILEVKSMNGTDCRDLVP